MKRKLFTLTLPLMICACIKPPDDGMALGEETSAGSVNKAFADAKSGVPDTQAFHVQDNGVIQSLETVFSSVKLKELDVYKITSIDSSFIYFTDYAVRANTTTNYKMARASNPSPAPAPSPVSNSTSYIPSITKNFKAFVQNIMKRFDYVIAKISIQPSTAVGDTQFISQPQRDMSQGDLRIQRKLAKIIGQKDATTIQTSGTSQPLTDSTNGTTHRFFGLLSYPHTYITNNCSQIKNCKVNATHIEFNQIDTTATTTQRVHWVYEISKEVPGLFTVMSRCGSSVAIVNNGQVPFMECEILDTFQFGGSPTSN